MPQSGAKNVTAGSFGGLFYYPLQAFTWCCRLTASWRQRAVIRRELRELYSADDRTLKDIGVKREEIVIRIRRSDLPF